ncbi:MAG: acetyl-CoA carboxylase biotin carboxyl carrier protein subunit [Thermofilum sp.]|nr:acetyl-CoA carboxylase biotin carboxyl carrier protein subunit [Thermofilum sp.]
MRKRFLVIFEGEAYEVEVEVPEGESPLQAVLSVLQTGVVRKVEAQPQSKDCVVAPITGKINQLLVSPGQRITRGATVAKIEAMKTLVEVKSSVEGTVGEVFVKEGDIVKQGQAIIRVRALGS